MKINNKLKIKYMLLGGLPSGSMDKASACNAGDEGRFEQSPGREDPLEEGVATSSSILAWKIPWTEGPGRLQSMGSQRVRLNRRD